MYVREEIKVLYTGVSGVIWEQCTETAGINSRKSE